MFERFTETGVKINSIACLAVAVAPASTFRRADHVALDGVAVYNAHRLLGGGAADTTG